MADYKKVTEHFPSLRPYANPNLVKRHGNVLTYRPNIQSPSITTDNRGFRRTVFKGESVFVSRSGSYEEIDVVLGSSHLFGVAAESDADTIPSMLGELMDQRVLSLTMPDAIVTDLVRAASLAIRPATINNLYLFPGGTFGRFCSSGLCSPMDGPPSGFEYPAEEYAARRARVDAETMFANMVRFQTTAIRQLNDFANKQGFKLIVVSERTFFEKEMPTAYELEAKLGEAANDAHKERFDRHLQYAVRYHDEVMGPLVEEGVTVIEYPDPQAIEFIDEFHPTPASNRMIAEHLAAKIAALAAS